ncbi:MAG: hypothetical protein MI861_15575, partial [Pirellulales bacterium]|nr:hypothetical protein [Pirellulales bacterium]
QVRCLTSEPKKLDSDNRDSPTGHRLSLIGSFTEVRAAMQAIENELPRACTTDLVMDRHDPAEPCRWELTLKLEGQAR